MNNEVIIKLVQKYQSRVFDIIKVVKAGNIDYEKLGKDTADLVNDFTNIKIGDFL